jgi:hypothetical protein
MPRQQPQQASIWDTPAVLESFRRHGLKETHLPRVWRWVRACVRAWALGGLCSPYEPPQEAAHIPSLHPPPPPHTHTASTAAARTAVDTQLLLHTHRSCCGCCSCARQTDTDTHTHTHTYTHTYTHTHTQPAHCSRTPQSRGPAYQICPKRLRACWMPASRAAAHAC